MKEVIKIDNVSYKVSNKAIVDGVSFSVNKHDTFALLGENGSGKSTLISLILNDLKADSGHVTFLEQQKNNFEDIGILYDHLPLFPLLKVFEIINYFSSIHKVDYSVIESNYFESFEIDKIINSFIKDLSQGERKRVGLLLSIMHNPSLLILDEPFANLDPTIIDRIWKVLKQDDRTVFLTTHNWKDAEKIATRIGFIFNGQLLSEIKSPQKIMENLPSDKKIIISDRVKMNGALNNFNFYAHDGELHIFFNDKSDILNSIHEFTDNFTVQDVALKDAYLYYIHNTKKTML